jgi:hypothetical protein
MIRFTGMAATIIAVAMSAGPAVGQTRQLNCTGNLIAQTKQQSPLTARVSLDSKKAVAIDVGSGVVNAPVVSNNQFRLTFRTKQFTGEFFHYSNDLFLIYPSGHLWRLVCT